MENKNILVLFEEEIRSTNEASWVKRDNNTCFLEGNKNTSSSFEEMRSGIALNKTAVTHFISLISSGKIDRTSSWEFTADDGNAILGKNDWEEYRKWFLGVRVGGNPETKEFYAYPIGKGGKVYRSGIIAAKQRAAQQGVTSIVLATQSLLEDVDKKQKEVIKEEALEGERMVKGMACSMFKKMMEGENVDSNVMEKMMKKMGCE